MAESKPTIEPNGHASQNKLSPDAGDKVASPLVSTIIGEIVSLPPKHNNRVIDSNITGIYEEGGTQARFITFWPNLSISLV